MKRPLFIIIGIVFVVILLAIWIYVLFFGGPQGNTTFTDLEFGDTTDTTVTLNQNEDGDDSTNVAGDEPKRLRQLTTKTVIGYEEVQENASTSPLVYFAEAGVGHIYSIDVESGEEVRISGTTIPSPQKADFTPDGKYVMIQSGQGVRSEFLVGLISSSSDSLTTESIQENIIDFIATNENTFLYAVQTNSSVIAREYTPETNSSATLFTIPFREARISWGENASDTHYAYPKAAAVLEGFAFQVENGNLVRIPADGYGFSVIGNEEFALFSSQIDHTYTSFLYNNVAESLSELPITVIPEKCATFNEITYAGICASTFTSYDHQIPDTWYTGSIRFSDNLWEFDFDTRSAVLLVDIQEESGREIDVIDIELSSNNEIVYFQNKGDRTLWLFERVIQN